MPAAAAGYSVSLPTPWGLGCDERRRQIPALLQTEESRPGASQYYSGSRQPRRSATPQVPVMVEGMVDAQTRPPPTFLPASRAVAPVGSSGDGTVERVVANSAFGWCAGRGTYRPLRPTRPASPRPADTPTSLSVRGDRPRGNWRQDDDSRVAPSRHGAWGWPAEWCGVSSPPWINAHQFR
jgi:hypothetical protein